MEQIKQELINVVSSEFWSSFYFAVIYHTFVFSAVVVYGYILFTAEDE